MKHLLIALTFLLGSSLLSAQEPSSNPIDDTTADSVDIESYDVDFDFDLDSDDFFSTNIKKKEYIIEDAPTIELFYGIGKYSYDDKRFTNKLAPNGIFEVKLGFTDIEKMEINPKIVEYDFSGLSISNSNREIANDEEINAGELRSRNWSLMIHNADGYGWAINDNVVLTTFHSTGGGWTWLNVQDKPTDSASAHSIGLFGNKIRYGKQFSAGVKLYLYKGIAITGEYEKSMIYPRHMFWKDMLSSIIEGSAQGLAGWFVNEIAEVAPWVAPIVHVAIKTGVSFGFYELYKEKMNWPVKTNAPFMSEKFKIGTSFSF